MKHSFLKKVCSGWFTTSSYLIIFLTYIFLQLSVWIFDSKPPLVVTGPAEHNLATPGELVKLKVPVIRERFCSVLMSRYLVDSQGTYYDLMATRFMSAEGLEQIALINPHHAEFSFEVPLNTAPGPAAVVTQLAYMCNPLQAIWPLDLDMRTKIDIGPRR